MWLRVGEPTYKNSLGPFGPAVCDKVRPRWFREASNTDHMGTRVLNPNITVRVPKIINSPDMDCCCCKCLNLNFLHSSNGMLKVIEMILGGLCQTMLMSFGPAQAQIIGMSFFSLLTANAAGTSVVTLLVLCYILSETSYSLIRTSLFEVMFNISAAFSYMSASTYLAIAVNTYLYPVYLVTMGFISYPAMVAAYTIGFALGLTHALDAYHAYRHYKGFITR